MLITWVGVILMEPTEFPLALPNCSESCGDVKIPYLSLWHKWRLLPENIFYQSWHLNQILETSLLQNVSIHGEMDILMSNYIDCYKHTTTRVCLWKTIWNYFSMSLVFSNIFFVEHKIFVKFCEMFYQRKFEKKFIKIKFKKKKKKHTHTHEIALPRTSSVWETLILMVFVWKILCYTTKKYLNKNILQWNKWSAHSISLSLLLIIVLPINLKLVLFYKCKH